MHIHRCVLVTSSRVLPCLMPNLYAEVMSVSTDHCISLLNLMCKNCFGRSFLFILHKVEHNGKSIHQCSFRCGFLITRNISPKNIMHRSTTKNQLLAS